MSVKNNSRMHEKLMIEIRNQTEYIRKMLDHNSNIKDYNFSTSVKALIQEGMYAKPRVIHYNEPGEKFWAIGVKSFTEAFIIST